MNNRNVLLIILAFMIVIILMILSYKVVYLAYLSTKVGCFPEKISQEQNQTFKIAGKIETNNNTATISIYSSNIPVIKHEYCHLAQFKQNRLSGCYLGGFYRFIDESECYIAQRLPDGLYKPIYGDYLA